MDRDASLLPGQRLRARGAGSNHAGRYEAQAREAFDDGWDLAEEDRLLRTEVRIELPRSALTYNRSPDLPFDRSINPYRGCEHGCIYCFARPSHAWLNLSPGLDFETRLIFKPEVGELLEKELRKPGYVCRPMALGTNTDPYQPVERTLKLTRAVLEVLDRFNHPVTIVTKSAGVVRDSDILASMARRRLARVAISVTTLDAGLARRMEPRAASPARRLAAVTELARAGIPVAVFAAPMIPGLNDSEMEKIIEAASRAGARQVQYILLRLPHELRQLFEDWLNTHYPERAKHVLNLIRETRAGALNDARFGKRFSGTGVYAELMRRRFERAARQWGLDAPMDALDTSRFAAPVLAEAQGEKQLSLF